MDRLYCADQIVVPPTLPAILKAYTKEVIRYNPADIAAFSRDYFAALANNDIEHFLSLHQQQQSEQRTSSSTTSTNGAVTA